MSRKGPIVFDLDETQDAPNPAQAAPVPDMGPEAPQGQAIWLLLGKWSGR
jgi:hypothetical protein